MRYPILLVLIATALTGRGAAAQDLTVAVYPFKASGGTAPGWTPAMDFGDHAAQVLETELVRIKGFSVMTRNRLKELAREQGLSLSNEFDSTSGPRLGRLLGVRALATGEVVSINVKESQSRRGVAQVAVQSVARQANAVVTVKLYSTETGRLIFAERVEGRAEVQVGSARQVPLQKVGCLITKLTNRGKNCGGMGDVQASDVKVQVTAQSADDIASAAIADAITKAVKMLEDRYADVVSKCPEPTNDGTLAANPAQIVAVRGGLYVLNRGSAAGLKEGDTLQITRLDEVIQTATGAIQPMTIIGTMEITMLGPDWAKGEFRARTVRGTRRPVARAEVGDRVIMVRAN
ncbi:MAG: hypothetical protein IPK85_05295 [Gemmatimonadetes bacterium]|nr:hypothetical protein [Gemmatimonadota bacterium]